MAFDWLLAYEVGAVLSSGILMVSLVSFISALRKTHGSVAPNTFRALVMFAISAIMLGMIAVTTVYVSGTVGQRIWIALYLIFIINCQAQVATSDRRVHYVTYLAAILAAVGGIVSGMSSPTEVSPVLGMALAISFVVSFIVAFYLVLDAPSPFTVGILLLDLAFLGAWFSILEGLVPSVPEALVLVFLPVVTASAILGSMLRKWHRTVSLFLGFVAAIPCLSVSVAGLISDAVGTWEIWSFGFVALFVSMAALASLEYFLQQIGEAGAKVPQYMAIALAVISTMAGIHSVHHTVFIDVGVGSPTMAFSFLLWTEWIIGLAGVSVFILAAFKSILRPVTFSAVRYVLIVLVSVLILLANEIVANGRWSYDQLFPALVGLIVFGILGYIEIARRLRTAGAGRAARNFVVFSLASLIFAVTIFMTEDLSVPIILVLLAISGIMYVSSSPRQLRDMLPSIGVRPK